MGAQTAPLFASPAPIRAQGATIAGPPVATEAQFQKPWPIFVDIPDPDNVLLCLACLKQHQGRKFLIVLAQRPVDFSVHRFNDSVKLTGGKSMFDYLRDKIPNEKDRPFSATGSKLARAHLSKAEAPTWLKYLDPKVVTTYFEPDKGFDDEDVRQDTKIYMKLSAYRFANFLRHHGIDKKYYDFYWDETSMDSTRMIPVLRHAKHVADYSYDFNNSEKDDFKKASKLENTDRRGDLRKVCETYIERNEKDPEWQTCNGNFLKPFGEFITDFAACWKKGEIGPDVMIGGPFTQPSKWLKWWAKLQDLPVNRITAMAFFIFGDDNVLPNQFNTAVDMKSTEEFVEVVIEKGIPLTNFCSEGAKGQPYRLRAVETDLEVADVTGLDQLWRGRRVLGNLVKTYQADSNTGGDPIEFDWMAAVMSFQLDADIQVLPLRKVLPLRRSETVPTWDGQGTETIDIYRIFRPSKPGNEYPDNEEEGTEPDSCIKAWWFTDRNAGWRKNYAIYVLRAMERSLPPPGFDDES